MKPMSGTRENKWLSSACDATAESGQCGRQCGPVPGWAVPEGGALCSLKPWFLFEDAETIFLLFSPIFLYMSAFVEGLLPLDNI